MTAHKGVTHSKKKHVSRRNPRRREDFMDGLLINNKLTVNTIYCFPINSGSSKPSSIGPLMPYLISFLHVTSLCQPILSSDRHFSLIPEIRPITW